MGWRGRDVISVLDFTRDDLEELFREADRARRGGLRGSLEGFIVALAFFEPSTRTRLSFESAAKRLGAETIGFTSEEATSVAKGESLHDTVKMLDSYADAIVIRHRYEGAALYAAEVAEHPVINAGDGRSRHPTQAFLDLYTVRDLFGSPEGLVYTILGDLRYARAAASLIEALTIYKPRKLYLVSPPLLAPRREHLDLLERSGVPYEVLESVDEVIGETDVLYVVRVQRERFPDPHEYEKVRGSYKVTPELLEKAKPTLKILHPLPRVDEVDPRVDSTPHAAYFHQASLGVPLRMALLKLVLKG
ncbi:aspartate carbamoyltransferase [Stetteria hydrogenophila]